MIFMHVPRLGDDVYPDMDPRLVARFQPQTAVPDITSSPTGPRPQPLDPNAPVPPSDPYSPQPLDPNAPVPTSNPYSPQPLDPYVPYPEAPPPVPPAAVTPTSVSPISCGWLCWALIGIGVVTVSGMAYYTFRRKR